MKVPFFDFNLAPASLKSEWQEAIGRVISAGRFIGGSEVSNFEQRWAEYLDTGFAVGVANGLDAITIGLRVLGIGPGSLVAVPSHTFIATWIAVDAVGATPIPVDCDNSGLMNLDVLEALSFSIDAVIPVHMHGQMVDMSRLIPWARLKGIKVIEDCAQAHGAKIKDKLAGTWGDIGAFSFYPTKNLGALGDGGMMVTANSQFAEIIRSYGNYGSKVESKYEYSRIGVNSRLDSIQAAVLNVNLKYLNEWNSRRREIAATYIERLSEYGINMLVDSTDRSVWHHFVVLSSTRDTLREELEADGICTEIHYPETAEDSFSLISAHISSAPINARKIATQSLSLPMSPWMTSQQVDYVLERITTDKILRNFRGDIK